MKVKALVTQLCPALCDLMDCSPPGSPVHGILLARILERVAIPFSRGSADPGVEPRPPALKVDSLLSEPPGKYSIGENDLEELLCHEKLILSVSLLTSFSITISELYYQNGNFLPF